MAMEQEPQPGPSVAELREVARSELKQAAGWATLGAAILIGSLRMDRLESQNINPYTVPGLLPGLLGVAMMLLAGLLALRSWRHGALAGGGTRAPIDPARVRRIVLVLALCIGFDVALVGHGLPFWLAAAIFVSVAIVSLQRPQRQAAGRSLSLRDLAVAAVIGLGAGGLITLVFQQLFLVRLP